MVEQIGDIKLHSLVTFGKDLHHQMSKPVVDLAIATENSTFARDKFINSTLEISPHFSERTLHPKNYRSAIILKTAMNLELKKVAKVEIHLGDFLPSARHEVLYGSQGKRYFELAFSSSWPSLHQDAQSVFPARYLSHIFTVDKFENQLIRHQGLATSLLKNVETFARNMGEKFVVLSTFATRENFFKKAGYEVVVKSANEIMMAKRLFGFALPLLLLGNLFKKDH